jgi:hypothetical protein
MLTKTNVSDLNAIANPIQFWRAESQPKYKLTTDGTDGADKRSPDGDYIRSIRAIRGQESFRR